MIKESFFHRLLSRNKINTFFKNDIKKKLFFIGGILLFLIILVVIIIVLSSRVNWDAAKESIFEKGMISIGLRTDIDGFAKKNEQSGVIEGYEADIAAEIVKRLFEEGINVDYREINSKTGKVFIEKGELDITLGAYIKTDAEDYLIYTDPYYTDAVIFYVRQGSNIANAEQINGKTIGMVSTSYAGYNNKLEDFLKSKGIQCKYKYFNAYPDSVDALKAGQVDVLAGGPMLMRPYVAGNAAELPGFVLPHGYCIALKKTNTELQKALNQILYEMKEDKTIERLLNKWRLTVYANE